MIDGDNDRAKTPDRLTETFDVPITAPLAYKVPVNQLGRPTTEVMVTGKREAIKLGPKSSIKLRKQLRVSRQYLSPWWRFFHIIWMHWL